MTLKTEAVYLEYLANILNHSHMIIHKIIQKILWMSFTHCVHQEGFVTTISINLQILTKMQNFIMLLNWSIISQQHHHNYIALTLLGKGGENKNKNQV